jgi:cytochrome c oxidase subunit 4
MAMEIHVPRKQYWIIFALLFLFTMVELAIVFLPLSWGKMVTGLCGLAMVKAYMVAIFYMHLGHETLTLRFMALLPMLIPGFYALILCAEGAARLVW